MVKSSAVTVVQALSSGSKEQFVIWYNNCVSTNTAVAWQLIINANLKESRLKSLTFIIYLRLKPDLSSDTSTS